MKNYERMKKMVTFTLVTALCVSMNMGTVTNAETLEDVGTSSSDVTANYVSSEIETIYSVDITWGSLEFTYTESGSQTWDPSTHTYSEATEGGWSYEEGSNLVTITNHSNSAVGGKVSCSTDSTYGSDVTLAMELNSDTFDYGAYEAVDYSYVGSISNAKFENALYFLQDASECALGDLENAPYIEIPFKISGDPDEFEDSVTIGTITITLKSAAGSSSIAEFLTSEGYA